MDELPGRPIWIELFTPDPDAAQAFYGDLFGWTSEDAGPEYGGYRLLLCDGAPVAGLMRNDGQGPSAWAVYLETNNADDTVAMAKANGGQMILEAHQVGDRGTMAVVTDPAGAMVGIWQPDEHPGFAALGEDNAPAWFELLTTAYDASIPFYENVFGWDTHTMSDTPEFRYTTLGSDDLARAGLMDGSAFLGDQAPAWSTYIQVADTDEALAKAVGFGATEVDAPQDTPYGRLASFADPQGVRLKVMGPNRG